MLPAFGSIRAGGQRGCWAAQADNAITAMEALVSESGQPTTCEYPPTTTFPNATSACDAPSSTPGWQFAHIPPDLRGR